MESLEEERDVHTQIADVISRPIGGDLLDDVSQINRHQLYVIVVVHSQKLFISVNMSYLIDHGYDTYFTYTNVG